MENKKRVVSFVDAKNVRYVITAKLRDHEGFKEFKIEGEEGQCQNKIIPDNKYQEELIYIWNRWHLNSMRAGTYKQILSLNKAKAEGVKLRDFEVYDYLDSLDAEGNPLTKIEYDKIAKKRKLLKEMMKDSKSMYKEDVDKLREEYKKYLLKTLLYDIDKNDNKVYEYGSHWFKEELPDDFWKTIEELFDNIEKAERSKFNTKKVSDCKKEELKGFKEAVIALGINLGLTIKELEEVTKEKYGYGDCVYKVEGHYYYSGTREEIRKVVERYISESLWKFTPEFLGNYGILKDIKSSKVILTLLKEEYEDGNEVLKDLVQWDKNKEKIVQDAIDADGIGCFLNRHNKECEEINVFNKNYIVCKA